MNEDIEELLKKIPEDFLGREVKEGDVVVYINHRRASYDLAIGKIKKVNNNTVQVRSKNPIHFGDELELDGFSKHDRRISLNKIIQINDIYKK